MHGTKSGKSRAALGRIERLRSLAMGAMALGLVLAVGGMAAAQPAPTARYRVTFESDWTAANHPIDYPTGIAHFSPLLVVTHDSDVEFWAPGQLASPGIENMAENGASSPFDSEVAAAVLAGDADPLLVDPRGGIGGDDDTSVVITASQAHPLLTAVAMLAPSPDWFVGVHGEALFTAGDWLPGAEFSLFTYDAGTDDGATFTADDIESVPHVPISLETSGSLGNGIPIGRFLVTRLAAPECDINVTQTSYGVGETIALDRFQIQNPGGEAGAAEFKFWIAVGDTEIGVFNMGHDNSFVIDALDVLDLGAQALATVEAGFPSGTWQVGCRLLNPTTGELYDADIVSFEVDGEN